MNIYKEAAKKKIRFTTKKGLLTVEDLFDLPMTTTVATRVSLNDIGVEIAKALKNYEVLDFIESKKDPAQELLKLKLEIIKDIIQDKKEERDKAKKEAEKKRQKELVMELIEKKKMSELENKSLEELERMLKES